MMCPKDHPAYDLWYNSCDSDSWAQKLFEASGGGYVTLDMLKEWFAYAIDTGVQHGLSDH